MDRQKRKAKEKKGTRRDYYVLVGILAYIGSLIFRIPLFYLIGEKGVGYFGIVNELYIVIVFFFSYGLSEATASLVRYRIKREQYKNVGKVLKGALILGGIIGIIFGAVFLLCGGLIADQVMKMPLCGLAMSIMAPAIFFCIMTGVLRGYFQGNGSRIPAMHSKILEIVFMIVGGLLGAWICYNYGEKVSALLLNENYAAAYGAMGACVGILASSVFSFLHMLILFLIYRNRAQKQERRDVQRYQEKGTHIIHILFGTAAPYGALGLVFHCLPLIGGYLFISLSEEVGDVATLWGKYYGKYIVVIYTISALLTLMGVEPIRKIILQLDREEYRLAKEKVRILLHQCVIWSVPSAVFTAVLSDNLLNMLFKGDNRDVAFWVMLGSVGIVFYVFSVLLSNLMLRLRKMKYVVGYGILALVLYCLIVVVLLKGTNLGILSLVIGNIVFYVVLAVTGFLLISRTLQYSQEWIRSVAFPIVSGGIAGLIVMLLDKAFEPMVGSVISLVICLPVGIVAYIILLLLVRSVNEKELGSMFLGRLLIGIGKALHLM